MSTIQSVKNQIQTLIDNANATTGKGDADLTTAQASLIDGYGKGGGGGSETIKFSETEITIPKVVSLDFLSITSEKTESINMGATRLEVNE